MIHPIAQTFARRRIATAISLLILLSSFGCALDESSRDSDEAIRAWPPKKVSSSADDERWGQAAAKDPFPSAAESGL